MYNIEFSEKYLRRPVVVPSTEEVIGEIGVPLFDRRTGRMEWILIKEPAPKKGTIMLEAKNVISVDEKEILVTPGPNMLYEYTQNMGEGSLRKKTIQLIGRDAVDESGIKIGTVSGVEVDAITLLLTSIIVVNAGGAMAFDRNKFYIGRDKVIIGRRKADIWTETISYEVKEILQEKRKNEKQKEISNVTNDKAEKIDINDCNNHSTSQGNLQESSGADWAEMKKKLQMEDPSLEDVRQRLNTLSSRIMKVVEEDEGSTSKKNSIPMLLTELNQVKIQLDGLNECNVSAKPKYEQDNDGEKEKIQEKDKIKEEVSEKEQQLEKEIQAEGEIQPEKENVVDLPTETQTEETKEDRKKTKQIKRITISSLFFPKEDADRIQALEGYFEKGDVELKYPKGYEKMQKKLAAKKQVSVGKIIFSQILGGSAFAAIYYVLTLLKMI